MGLLRRRQCSRVLLPGSRPKAGKARRRDDLGSGWCEAGHGGGFLRAESAGGWGWGADLLLVLGGAVTALPLIGFAYGVRRIPLSLVGLFQYVAPTLQFLIGVLVFREPFDAAHATGFAAIWAGLALFAGEGAWRARHRG